MLRFLFLLVSLKIPTHLPFRGPCPSPPPPLRIPGSATGVTSDVPSLRGNGDDLASRHQSSPEDGAVMAVREEDVLTVDVYAQGQGGGRGRKDTGDVMGRVQKVAVSHVDGSTTQGLPHGV